MKIKFIIGQAGTAKTTNLMKIAFQLFTQRKSFICLAYTHSAVHNMIEKFKKNSLNTKFEDSVINRFFKTIHSYLGIIPTETGYCFQNSNFEPHDYILVDEFSLIDLDTLNYLLDKLKSCKDINLIFAGDILQLNPVNTNPIISYELFKKIDIKTDISSAILVGKHLSNNIYSNQIYTTSNKLILTKNFRFGTNVMNILDKAIKNDYGTIYRYNDQMIKKFINDGYVVISSKYKNLQKIYSYTQNIKTDLSNSTILSRIGEINIDKKMILTKNINKNFTNGQVVQVYLTDKDDEIKIKNDQYEVIIKKSDPRSDNTLDYSEETEDKKMFKNTKSKINNSKSFPLLPLNFYSIFKAQGKSFDNVIIVLDDLFEITMLYTGITRAKNNVVFTHIHKLDDILEDLKIKNNAFNILKQIIYPSKSD